MLVIHLGLSCATQPTILPDPLFRIWVNRLHKAKRGSDSGTYDAEGWFRPQSFEDVFVKYDGEKKGGPSGRDVWAVWDGQRCTAGFYGWAATGLECE
jgi:peroxygenase